MRDMGGLIYVLFLCYIYRNRYVPENDPWILSDEEKWQPLTEDNGRGFVFNQDHILPHIGYTGKSLFYKDEEVCQRKIYDPFYNYTYEIELLFDHLASLTDEIKMEIEFFDDKVASLTVFSTNYAVGTGNDFDKLEGAFSLILESIVNYEAVLAVWKEKVDYNRVRPTSIVRKLYQDKVLDYHFFFDCLVFFLIFCKIQNNIFLIWTVCKLHELCLWLCACHAVRSVS